MKLTQLRRLPRAAAIALATIAIAGVMSAPASGAQTGLNVAGFFATPAQNAAIESVITRLHPAWIRVFLNWNQIEPSPGNYFQPQLADYKALFAALPGVKVDIDVVGSPAWANGGSANPSTPPVNDQSYAAFMNYLANTFGSTVAAYELWNEEDANSWWTGTPEQYASLVEATYPAIKAANPNATVMLGANNPTFLQKLYNAGVRNYFDADSVHTDSACSLNSPYAFAYVPGTQTIDQWSFLGFTNLHALMAANGDGAKPIYMTELGWSTTSTTCAVGASAGKKAAGVSPKTQALYLQQAYHCLAQPQYSYVTAAMWFDMVDFGSADTMNNRYGLTSTTLAPKPSFTAFAQEASGDPLNGPCGNFNGPTLRLVNPSNGQRYSGRLLLRVSATASGNAPGDRVLQIAIKHDGKTILNFNRIDARYVGGRLSGQINWMGARYLPLGRHTISAVAINANGVTSTVAATVIHVSANHKPSGASQVAPRKHHKRKHKHHRRSPHA